MEKGKTAEWMTYQPLDIRAALVCMGSPKDMRWKGCLRRRYILTHSRATCSGSNVSDVRTKVEGRIAFFPTPPSVLEQYSLLKLPPSLFFGKA